MLSGLPPPVHGFLQPAKSQLFRPSRSVVCDGRALRTNARLQERTASASTDRYDSCMEIPDKSANPEIVSSARAEFGPSGRNHFWSGNRAPIPEPVKHRDHLYPSLPLST